MSTSFTSIPLVDFSRLDNPETKQAELAVLRHAVFNVGFLYIVETGLEVRSIPQHTSPGVVRLIIFWQQSLIKEAHARMPEIFAIPIEEKQKVSMLNSPAFLGYTGLGTETTANQTDIREVCHPTSGQMIRFLTRSQQFDFGTECPDWSEGDPFWQRVEGPTQFPNDSVKDLVTRYNTSMTEVGRKFVRYVAECLALPSDTFEPFLGAMSRLKFIKYPPAAPGSQGVGPHKDIFGFFTFLAQDNVGGLQVLNKSGEWIDATPVEGSIVVNVAQGFEAVTGGVCSGTTHRVVVCVLLLSPALPPERVLPLTPLIGPNFNDPLQYPLFPGCTPGSQTRRTEALDCRDCCQDPCLGGQEEACR